MSITKRSGLVFNVYRVHRMIRSKMKISKKASVFLTAAVEYLCAEILELAGCAAFEFKRKRLHPRHIMLAVRGDDELTVLFPGIFPFSGVISKV